MRTTETDAIVIVGGGHAATPLLPACSKPGPGREPDDEHSARAWIEAERCAQPALFRLGQRQADEELHDAGTLKLRGDRGCNARRSSGHVNAETGGRQPRLWNAQHVSMPLTNTPLPGKTAAEIRSTTIGGGL